MRMTDCFIRVSQSCTLCADRWKHCKNPPNILMQPQLFGLESMCPTGPQIKIYKEDFNQFT